jgi:adenosylcobinamide kinase/adenosylcobinamide-phosphate guanylyltransferase
MHFIFGGRGMGKLDYAKGLVADPVVCDLSACDAEEIFSADILYGAHLLVKRLMHEGRQPEEYFRGMLERLAGKIVIGDEVGSGIVPVDAFERAWRDEVGRVYQLLAAHAKRVTRVWAGLPQELKRDGAAR